MKMFVWPRFGLFSDHTVVDLPRQSITFVTVIIQIATMFEITRQWEAAVTDYFADSTDNRAISTSSGIEAGRRTCVCERIQRQVYSQIESEYSKARHRLTIAFAYVHTYVGKRMDHRAIFKLLAFSLESVMWSSVHVYTYMAVIVMVQRIMRTVAVRMTLLVK